MRHDRREFLHGLGASIALPMLERFGTATAHAAERSEGHSRRLVCAGTYLGFYQPSFFPSEPGSQYSFPTGLAPLEGFRDKLTIFSGLDHRGRNGHHGWKAWLSGSAAGRVSFDQLVARHVGDLTRFDSLQVTCGNPPQEARMSFTPEGVALPMIGRPSVLYTKLFQSGMDKRRVKYLLSTNRSVLDGAVAEARALERDSSAADREKLGEYFASVRSVERRLKKQIMWLDRPLPEVDYPLPEFDPVAPNLALECESIMYDLIGLALVTDSTRVISFVVPGWSQVFNIGGRNLSAGYHGLSHHGNDPQRIADYTLVGMEHAARMAGLLKTLESATDGQGRSLLDTTAVLFGSGMGDANTHDNSNLPTMLAGGEFRHGAHWQHDRTSSTPRLLGDLFLTMMQSFGMDVEHFAGARSGLAEDLA